MHRFFVPSATLDGDEVLLPAATLHHLTVLRLRAGDEIELLDGRGAVWQCRLVEFSRRQARGIVLSRRREGETGFAIRLLQGLPKGEKMELILQKGVELGVTTFTPLLSGRSVASKGKGERWERIVEEAARQSRRAILPRLEELTDLRLALTATTEELRLMLWEGGTTPLAAALPAVPPRDCALLVGPEGGFAAEEAALAAAHGFVAVSLGGRILRTETAGFAVAAILQHRYGDLGR